METVKAAKKHEDEYFARVEYEQRKKKLDEQRSRMERTERDRLKKEHWMRCPKCGMEMVEIAFQGVMIDKCSSCLGIYLDNGELDQLLDKKNAGLAQKLFKVFKG